jgi:RNA polymerase sigma-70 factor (ECF subfamily)
MASTSAAPVGIRSVTGSTADLGGGRTDLVERAAGGDVQAFEDLYRAHVGRVYAVCLRMTGDAHLAEEMVQESFVQAWQKLTTFRGASAFSTWLHRVAVNVVLGHLRGAGRRWASEVSPADEAVPDRAAPTAHPGQVIDLERAIGSLPDGAREVFVLHDMEGFKHHEISDLMGIAVGTSKAQLHRARKILRKALKS